MRKLLLAAAAAAAFGAAASAHAATVLISASHLANSSDTVHIAGTVDGDPLPYRDVYEAPEVFTVSVDGGPSHDIIAFCVDLFHLWAENYPPVTYVTSPVQNNSNSTESGGGTPLSNLISGEIGYLANIGQHTSDGERLAGIQGAIWSIEYPDIQVQGGSTYLNTYVNAALAWGAAHPQFAGYADGLYASNGQTQGFGLTQGFTTGGVPEPAAWTLMIGGFGLAGATLRRRRAATAA